MPDVLYEVTIAILNNGALNLHAEKVPPDILEGVLYRALSFLQREMLAHRLQQRPLIEVPRPNGR